MDKCASLLWTDSYIPVRFVCEGDNGVEIRSADSIVSGFRLRVKLRRTTVALGEGGQPDHVRAADDRNVGPSTGTYTIAGIEPSVRN